MKICLISFDFWNYDHHIVDALQKKGIDAHHINLRDYKHDYPTPFHRAGNFFGKLILNRNVKKLNREEFIIQELSKLGRQDKILVINPEVISTETHQKIKIFTNKYIAYLYDSSKRSPIDHLLEIKLFDTVFSFDPDDVKTYNLIPLTNYIYFDKKPVKKLRENKYDCFTICYLDERLTSLNKIAEIFEQKNLISNLVVVGDKKLDTIHDAIIFSQERLDQKQVHQQIEKSKSILDLLRDDQAGLSFRIFEALGFQKKVITTNKHVADYDFYNPENILIIDPENPQIPKSFFTTPYVPLSDDMYKKYSLEGWVENVFDLK